MKLGYFGRPREPWRLGYDGLATEDDILHCFRLLLGRNPHREEWRGHSSRAGEPLAGVVASYLGSLEFAQRGLLQQDNLQEIVRSQLDGFQIFSAADDAAVGRYVREANYEPEVTAVFRRLLRPGMAVIDIGANIGYFSMLAATLVGPSGHVLAVEPNPRNARLLEASRRVNGFDNVVVCQTAAGRETGLLVLNTSHSNGTTSGLPPEVNDLLGATTVPCVTIDALVGDTRRIDFVKIDVEGAEYNALLGAEAMIRRCRPIIVSEFSPDLMPGISGVSGPDYLSWLIAHGYALSVIEPDGTLAPGGPDGAGVMATYRARACDHIDIVARAV